MQRHGRSAGIASSVMLLAAVPAALGAPGDPGPTRPRPPVEYTPLVLSGEEAPGFDGQAFTAFPYHSVVNDASYTVFLGSTRPPPYGGHDPDGIFLNRRGDTSLVAKAGQPAPGMPLGVTLQSFDINFHKANNLGQVVFESSLAGPGIDNTGSDDTNAHASWLYTPGAGLTKIAQFRDPAPGFPGLYYRTFSRTTVNDLGHVAFSGDVVGPEGGQGGVGTFAFWYGEPGDLQVLAREGEAVPGHPNLTYAYLSGFNYPVLSPRGKVAFVAGVTGPGIYYPKGVALVGTPGELVAAAVPGQVAPGSGTTFSEVLSGHTEIDINDRGETAFAAFLGDGRRAIYAGKPGHLRLVARTQTPMPGYAGRSFDFFFGIDLNERGDVAFLAESGADERAVYLDTPQRGLELIGARGQPAPGTEEGVTFGWFFSYPVVNKDGQVAFFASLEGPGSRGEGDYAIFATGHNGDLRLVARVGDTFEVADGDVRTISALSYAGIYGGHILTFNEDSDLSFLIKFTDGTQGLFTARVLPEPGTLAALALLAPLLLRRRRAPWHTPIAGTA